MKLDLNGFQEAVKGGGHTDLPANMRVEGALRSMGLGGELEGARRAFPGFSRLAEEALGRLVPAGQPSKSARARYDERNRDAACANGQQELDFTGTPTAELVRRLTQEEYVLGDGQVVTRADLLRDHLLAAALRSELAVEYQEVESRLAVLNWDLQHLGELVARQRAHFAVMERAAE